METVAKEYYKNQYSILIVKCCASCLHHEATNDDNYRLCKIGGRKCRNDFLCRSWKMNPNLDNAGKGGGMVKKPQYIQYCREYGIGRAEEYERQYGSRYLTKQ